MNVQTRIQIHIALAYANHFLAKANTLQGYEMLAKGYREVAKMHLISAKQFKKVMLEMEN